MTIMGHPDLFGGEDGLAHVVGEVTGAAEEDGEAVAGGVFGEVFFGDGGVAFEPLGGGEGVEGGKEFFVDRDPGEVEVGGGQAGGCAVGGFEIDVVEFGVETLADAEQGEHGVVDGDEVAPDVDEAVLAGGDGGVELVRGEAGDEFGGAIEVYFEGFDGGGGKAGFLRRHGEGLAFVCDWGRLRPLRMRVLGALI